MKQIVDIFFKRLLFDDDEFPYIGDQDLVQIIQDDLLVIEFSDGQYCLFTLENELIEYSVEQIYFSKNSLLSINPKFSKKREKFIESFLNVELKEIKSLHLINGQEIDSDKININQSTSKNKIGVKFIFENDNELFIYSAEPEMISFSKFQVFRESSTLCMILNDKKSLAQEILKNSNFPRKYEFVK